MHHAHNHEHCCCCCVGCRLVEEDDDGEGEDGSGGGAKRVDIGAVYQEMASSLMPKVIKRNATGEQFRCALQTLPYERGMM